MRSGFSFYGLISLWMHRSVIIFHIQVRVLGKAVPLQMALSCVVLDKDSDEYSRLLCFFFLFVLDCTRAADRNFTGLVTVHLSTVKELQRQYDITTGCEVRRLTLSPNRMVTQGGPWGRKGSSAFDLLSYASALSLPF